MNPEEALAAFGPSPNRPDEHTEFVSTGSLGLDLALGTGGWPVGKISVIYGPAFTAKTTLALSSAREMQRLGVRSPKYSPTVAYVNYDHGFSPEYAHRIGIDTGRLLVFNEIPPAELICPVDFMVVDSMWWGEDAEEVRNFAAQHDVTVVAVSQVRAALGNPLVKHRDTTGWLEEAPVRVRMQKYDGQYIAAVARNPWQPEPASCTFDIGNSGIDHAGEVFQAAMARGLIEKLGSWYHAGGRPLGQGRTVAQRRLQDDTELLAQLERDIRGREEGKDRGIS